MGEGLMAEAKKSDPARPLIILLGLAGFLWCVIDWPTFAILGNTSASTVVRIKGMTK